MSSYIQYVPKKFADRSMQIIDHANAIIEEYEADGFSLTLRQLYYQFVSRDIFANDVKNYNALGNIISDARLAGLVSWTAIEDRTRNLKGRQFQESPQAVLKSALEGYQLDKWATQEWRPEVWIEKEALVGVISQMCLKHGISWFACRGYNSQSEQWRAGQRFQSYIKKGQRPVVLHLGDHDPSGLDMTRDNRDRLEIFCHVPILVVRLALNMEQIRQYDPPPNPAKLTDSRAEAYVGQFGKHSWELDALSPTVINSLIEMAIREFRDDKKWDEMILEELEDKATLERLVKGLEGYDN